MHDTHIIPGTTGTAPDVDAVGGRAVALASLPSASKYEGKSLQTGIYGAETRLCENEPEHALSATGLVCSNCPRGGGAGGGGPAPPRLRY